ncbi:hypothetical protein [Acidocella sp.]|uniref:hypothetical protein n=1 Tax=Acidocella sp. TaxID=50710 RepID=UPI002626CA96|nr:hypothetical protein [Acidocella sp.]
MTRDELYQLVWSKPVTHVAKDYGVSDVAIRKVCKKYGIPLPPLGYWAKLQHGKKVRETPLPPPQPGQSGEINLKVHNRPELADDVIEAEEVARGDEAKPERRITVPTTRPDRLHPIAAATEKALRKAKPDHEGFVASGAEDKIGVVVGQSSIDRAILLINTFLEAVIERGHQLTTTPTFNVMVDNQPLKLSVHETKVKIQHVPTTAELKEQAKHDQYVAQYPTFYSQNRKVYRTWDYIPSGRLVVEICDPLQAAWRSAPVFGRWYDRKTSGVETYINEMMVTLVTGAAIAKNQRAKEAEQARLAKEAEERRQENERQARLLARATEFLTEKAKKHELLERIVRLGRFLDLDTDATDAGQFSELRSTFDFVVAHLRQQISANNLNQEVINTRLLDRKRWY